MIGKCGNKRNELTLITYTNNSISNHLILYMHPPAPSSDVLAPPFVIIHVNGHRIFNRTARYGVIHLHEYRLYTFTDTLDYIYKTTVYFRIINVV